MSENVRSGSDGGIRTLIRAGSDRPHTPIPYPARRILGLTSLAMLGIGLAIVALLEITQQARERRSAAEIGYQFVGHLEEQLVNALSATYALSAAIQQGRGTIADFESLAHEMLKLYPGIDAIQLAPDGIVRQIVPLAGHEAALGHDLLKPEVGNREALLALATRRLALAGPFRLRQGGDGIVGRLPVFLTDTAGAEHFWGFSIALIRLPRFLEAARFDRLEQAGYSYVLWRSSPDTGDRQVIAASSGALRGGPVRTVVAVPNGQWLLDVTPAAGWYGNLRIVIGSGVTALLTTLFAAMMGAYLRNRQQAWDSAESHRLLFESVQEAVHVCTADGRFLAVNPGVSRLYGRPEAWLVGQSLGTVAAPDRNDLEDLLRLLDDALHGRPRRADFWGVRGDGRLVQVEFNLVGSNYRGQPAVIAVGRDVTERARLARRERLRNTILERIAGGDALCDILGTLARDVEQEAPHTLCSILLIDDGGRRLLHGAAPSLPGFYNQAVNGLEIGPRVGSCGAAAATRQRVIVEDIASHPNWVAFRTVAEQAGLASCWSEPITGHRGQVLGTFAIYHREPCAPQADDIDLIAHAASLAGIAIERDADQRALRESEARFRALIEGASDAFFAHDLGGTLVAVNQTACDSVGCTRQDLLAMRIEDLFEEGDTLNARSQWAALQPGQAMTLRCRQRRPDGSGFPVEVRLSACELAGQRLILRLSRDITERVRNEAELERHRHHLEDRVAERTAQLHRANAELEAANRAKSTFLANMSHEIRTPLNAIVGLTHLLLRTSRRPDDEAQLRKITEAADHLLSIINDILDISKIEAGKLQLEESDFHLEETFESISALLAGKAREKGLGWDTTIAPGVDGPLRGDALRLRQILLNLAGNALKFTETGSIRLQAHRAGMHASGITVRFEVTDTGIGIAPDSLPRLFKAFEQSDNSITRRYGGTGLGLVICKRLAGLMGGEIGVDSTPGRGSTFWFTARFSDAQSATPKTLPATTSGPAAEAVARAHAGARLLLAEDNPLNREVACALLADCALLVDTAENGQQAIVKAEATDYSLILMDVQMPILDGLEATRRIRRLPRHAATPIIAMTANAFDSDRDACLKAGMNHHLAKPIVPAVLYAALLRWLPAATATPTALEEAASQPPTPPDAAGHEFCSIEGLDPVRGLDHLAGNVATYRRVLRLFAERVRSDLKQLRDALAGGERDAARRIAHTIKGTAATLGAITVEPLAARLEAALRDAGDAAAVSALADALDTEYRAVSGSILAGLDSAADPPGTGSGAAAEREPAA